MRLLAVLTVLFICSPAMAEQRAPSKKLMGTAWVNTDTGAKVNWLQNLPLNKPIPGNFLLLPLGTSYEDWHDDWLESHPSSRAPRPSVNIHQAPERPAAVKK